MSAGVIQGPPKVLVVDDENVVRSMIVKLLGQAGCKCDEAEDGQVALSRVRTNKYDLVITDLSKPRIDGAALCRKIRSMRTDQYVYVLVAVDSPVMIRAGLEAGADDFLLKPIAPESLEGRLVVAWRRPAPPTSPP